MTLNKQKMVREIGRRTRMTNREVQEVVEALVEVWTESLVKGERIEIQNFFVLEAIDIDRGSNTGMLRGQVKPARMIRRLVVRASKNLRKCFQKQLDD